MKQFSIHIILLVEGLIFSTSSVGQVHTDSQLFRDSLYRHISQEMSAELSCRFTYTQGSNAIDSHLGRNAAELNKLDDFIHQALNHPTLFISRIQLTGYSSIEGNYAKNETLSRERAEHFHAYLQTRYPKLYHYPHSVAWVAEDWQGLSKMIRASSINERMEILEIIRKVPGFDERERLLAYLNGGRPYQIMAETMFPKLRRVELQIEYTTEKRVAQPATSQLVIQTAASPQPSPKEREQEDTSPQELSSFGKEEYPKGEVVGLSAEAAGTSSKALFALKTNTLLWAGIQHDFKHTTPIANIALEYYISNHYSIELGAMYSYWRYNSNQKFQGISAYRFEPRYRFSLPLKRQQMEIYLGIYGRFGDYDLRTYNLPSNPCGINYTGDYWDVGLSGGITINLVDGLALEVGVRGGYMNTRPIKYTMDNYQNWFEGRYKYYQFKVIDLNVSLVYRFR